MAAQVNCCHPALVLVDGDGNFKKNIEQDLNLANENCPVAAVTIIGVQSTGKSTLLNKCFSTSFEEMDHTQGMSQTTKGIWIAKDNSPNAAHKILVIDTEGTDGFEQEREGNNRFEGKTTLFALAMSDVVIFNMKCDSVNLHQGASRPLMETVFQVMVRKFSTPRRVNLVFVLRDKNMCPLEKLTQQVKEQLYEIWDGMEGCPQGQASRKAALTEYFNVEVVAMSHYRYEREAFDIEVVKLREQIFGLVGHGRLGPASGFIALAERNWNDIQEDKILNLQTNRMKVADIICNYIKMEKIKKLGEDQFLLQIQRDVESGIVRGGFGDDVTSLIDICLSQYLEETLHLDEGPRNECRKQLTEQLLKDVEPIYISLVKSMRDVILENFLEEIVLKMKAGGKLEAKNSDKFIAQFEVFLKDAHIKQTDLNRTCEELEKLRSELASYEEGAHYISTKLKELKTMEIWIRTMAIGVGMSATALLTVGVVGVVRMLSVFAYLRTVMNTTGRSFAGATASVVAGLFKELGVYREKLEELKEACEKDPFKKAIMMKYKW